jgi:hypothetical protein
VSKHAIRIETASHALLTRIYLDGQELRGVMAVSVEIDPLRDRSPRITLTITPRELVIEGSEVPITFVAAPQHLKQQPPDGEVDHE